MKILQVNKFFYNRGGAERYLSALIELFQKKSHQIFGFSQKTQEVWPNFDQTDWLKELDLSHPKINLLWRWPNIFWNFSASSKIKKIIRKNKPELVHLHNIYHQISPSILPAIKSFGLPIVMTVHDFKLIRHDYTLRADNRRHRHKNSLLIDSLLKAEFAWHRHLNIYQKNIDLFIVPSQFVKNKLLENNFPAEKITVIPHFLETEFKPKKSNAKFGDYIFAYGRLDESKGFDDLLDAFAEIKISGLKLLIAGAGPEKSNLENKIKKLNLTKKVQLIGHKNKQEIIDLIAGSLFVVNCSKVHETFGLTVLEAMSLQKTVIASKVGAIPELIEAEKNGLLYQAGDAGDLKRQLLYLINNPLANKKMAKEALLTAQQYTPQKHYEAIISAYKQAQKNNTKPLRHVHLGLVNVIFFLLFCWLLTWPFYQLNIPEIQALNLPEHGYPRLTNLYWRNPIDPATAKELAKWDILALDMTAQAYSASAIKEIRKMNPRIIILAYTSANEMPTSRLDSVEPSGYGLWHDLAKGDKNVWHLKNSAGNDLVFWPGNVLMNLSSTDENGQTYADYLVDFYDKKIIASGLWDGFLFDNTWQKISGLGQAVDINNDGRNDSNAEADRIWFDAYNTFFKKLRERIGSGYLIITNGDGDYSTYANGRMFESFPEYWEGGWSAQMNALKRQQESGFRPRLNIINADSNNTGNQNDFKTMRFGLTSALMFDAYYSFDYGPALREHLWWYDEYEADLGKPLGSAFNLLGSSNNWQEGLWQRDFENGIVLINSTNREQKITFEADYEKLKGKFDTQTNDGSVINQAVIPAQDGLILLKPINEIVEGSFINGSFARIFEADGRLKRSGFFIYDKSLPGGSQIIKTDINNDGNKEMLVSYQGEILLYDHKKRQLKKISPYGNGYRGSISIAIANNEQGQKNIIISPISGQSNLIKILNNDLSDTDRKFYAYNQQQKNLGANISACDLNNDGVSEIVVGAGRGGGPHVKVFDLSGKLLNEWFAYSKLFRGGVNVSCSQLNTEQAQIITGVGWGGGPHLRIFDSQGNLLRQWFAYDKTKRQGVTIKTLDIDGDGLEEIGALSVGIFSQQ